jgi:hypothetical protein
MLWTPARRTVSGVPRFTGPRDIIGLFQWFVAEVAHPIIQKLNRIEFGLMADFDEVRADYKAFAQAALDRAKTAEDALAAADARADSSDAALAAFVADDAATDASQLLEQRQADGELLKGDLDSLRNTPLPEPPVDVPVDVPVDPEVPADPA